MAAGNWHLIFTPVQIGPHLVQKCKIGEQARTRTSTISASEIIVLVVVLVLVLEKINHHPHLQREPATHLP